MSLLLINIVTLVYVCSTVCVYCLYRGDDVLTLNWLTENKNIKHKEIRIINVYLNTH